MKKDKRSLKGLLVPVTRQIAEVSGERSAPPAIITETGTATAFAYTESFGAEIESTHTYRAYRHAVDRFLVWCAERNVPLQQIGPALVGDYLRTLFGSKPTKKLYLSALQRFF